MSQRQAQQESIPQDHLRQMGKVKKTYREANHALGLTDGPIVVVRARLTIKVR